MHVGEDHEAALQVGRFSVSDRDPVHLVIMTVLAGKVVATVRAFGLSPMSSPT
jgi:hypothetical protein